jgi:hypothetical protein
MAANHTSTTDSNANSAILSDQNPNASTGTDAKHVAIGVGIAILVIVLTGLLVAGVYMYLRKKRWSRYTRRSPNSRSNTGKLLE